MAAPRQVESPASDDSAKGCKDTICVSSAFAVSEQPTPVGGKFSNFSYGSSPFKTGLSRGFPLASTFRSATSNASNGSYNEDILV
eukprot:scaffold36476_cov252-Amphora_coffeaeformis.AAC.10